MHPTMVSKNWLSPLHTRTSPHTTWWGSSLPAWQYSSKGFIWSVGWGGHDSVVL